MEIDCNTRYCGVNVSLNSKVGWDGIQLKCHRDSMSSTIKVKEKRGIRNILIKKVYSEDGVVSLKSLIH